MADVIAAKVSSAAAKMAQGCAGDAERLMNEAAAGQVDHILQATTSLLLMTNDPYCAHFACDLLKKAAVRDWNSLPPAARQEIFNFATTCLQSRGSSLHPNTLEQLLNLFAVIAKLGWPTEDAQGPSASSQIIDMTLEFLKSDNKACGVSLARHLLVEFQSTDTGTLGMVWERHEMLRQSFQTQALPQLFSTVFSSQYISAAPSGPFREMLLRLISEGLLSWDYSKRTPDGQPEESIKITPEWRELVLNKSAIECLLALHSVASFDEQHHIHTAIIQLCGIHSQAFINKQEKLAWIEYMLNIAFELASRSIQGYTAERGSLVFASCKAFQKISWSTTSTEWYVLPSFPTVVQRLTEFTAAIAREHGNRPDDEWLVESVDTLLCLWGTHLIDMLDEMCFYGHTEDVGSPEQKGLLRQSCKAIFEAFLDGQMKAPIMDSEEGAHEKEYGDSTRTLVAILGRQVPDECLADLIGRLQSLIAHLSQGKPLDDSFHDVMFVLVSVGCALVADPGVSEVPGIPIVLVDASRKHEAAPDTNGVVYLVGMLFNLLEGLLGMAASNQSAVSPFVVASILSGLARWARSYIAPDRDANIELTPVFTGAFNEGKTAAEKLIALSTQALCTFASDTDVTRSAMEALMALASKQALHAWLCTCNSWITLASQEASENSPLQNLPLSVRKSLIECLCIGTGKDAFVNLLPPIEQAARALLSQTGTAVTESKYVNRLLLVLARIRGVCCSSVQGHQRMDAVFNWIRSLFPVLIQLSDTYHMRCDVIVALFELLDDLVKAQTAFLEEGQVGVLLQYCFQMIESYRKHNSNVQISSRRIKQSENDDKVDTLVAMMVLLKDIVKWDMLGYSGDEGRRMDAGEIVLLGLHYIIGLVSPEFLSDSSLTDAFYELLDDSLTLYCDKVTLIPEPLIEQVKLAILYAIGEARSDILKSGYRSVAALANFYKHSSSNPASAQSCIILQQLLPLFLQRILESTHTERLPPCVLSPMSNAVICLVSVVGLDVAAHTLRTVIAAHPLRDRIDAAFVQALNVLKTDVPNMKTKRLVAEEFRKQYEHFALVCRTVRM
eukprot:TRINITY_DN4003_c0_g2_i1.p1 TRINITY_DN4003_c0_g2~~TRINITY_DN4003_c0_g2_i1.p1  ORF type:complete len:1077 (+),score=294.22 TRINITY_DN4003_c0_g2_i1:29-3232(+)